MSNSLHVDIEKDDECQFELTMTNSGQMIVYVERWLTMDIRGQMILTIDLNWWQEKIDLCISCWQMTVIVAIDWPWEMMNKLSWWTSIHQCSMGDTR